MYELSHGHNETINVDAGDAIFTADAFSIKTDGLTWTSSRVVFTAVKAWAWALNKPVYVDGVLTPINELQPKYSSDFRVTMPKK